MHTSLDTLVARIIAAERVLPEDTAQLRDAVWANGAIDTHAADSIFAINCAVKKTCPQWVDFFVEAITAYLLEATQPTGAIDGNKSAWLIAQIGNEGNIDSRAELLLLVALLEKAEAVDARLRAYAIAQVERTVVTGEGSTRIGAALRPGVIDEADVALLRRVFQGPQSAHGTGILQSEAESLFRIKAATQGQENAQGWTLLFVQLLGQFLIEGPNDAPVERRRTILSYFVAETMPGVGAFLSRLEQAHCGEQPLDDSPAPLTGDEIAWLKGHIVADGALDEIEKALLAYIVDEASPLPAELEALTEVPTALTA